MDGCQANHFLTNFIQDNKSADDDNVVVLHFSIRNRGDKRKNKKPHTKNENDKQTKNLLQTKIYFILF